MEIVATVFLFAFPFLVILVLYVFAEPSGRGRSRDHNRAFGRWRVRYKDGNVSEPMMRDVAEDYAEMFGGTIERIKK